MALKKRHELFPTPNRYNILNSFDIIFILMLNFYIINFYKSINRQRMKVTIFFNLSSLLIAFLIIILL